MATIKLVNIVKKFGKLAAVNNLSLEIRDKEFVVLLGPSGCGKTTTLRSIAGLETIDEGEILIDGKVVNNIRASERNIAFVFQLYALYPHLTAYNNIAFPLKAQRVPKIEIKTRINDVVRMLEIEHILNKKPRELSGGDMQRVALGRAIVRRPKVFLMDEPIGTLDTHFREQMRSDLTRLHLDIGATTVYVTHDQVEAMSMGNRIAIMDSGVLQQIGTPLEIYNSPANLFVANFIGSPSMDFVNCRYIKESADKYGLRSISSKLIIKIPDNLCSGITRENLGDNILILGIRFEDVKVNSQKMDGFLQGKVYICEQIGPYNIINIKIGEDIIKAKSPPSFRPEVGSKIWFNLDTNRIHIFDKNTGLAIT